MKDKELKLNASGYYDEPCYKTMTAAPKPGEIWTHSQSGAYMLVIANVNGVCPTLRLNEQEKEGCIPVTCMTVMYTNPAFMGYVFETNLSRFVKCLKEEEFKVVKKVTAELLGLGGIHEYVKELEIRAADMLEEHNERDALLDRVKTLEDERNKLLEEISGYGETIKKQGLELRAKEQNIIMLGESLNKVSREADRAEIYKDMYMTLLDKVISSRGGSVNE